MTKAQLITEINAITVEFCGSQLAGLGSMSKVDLQAKLERFQQMIAHHRAYNAVMVKFTEQQRRAFSLMGEQAPAEYQSAWQEQTAALHIWRNQ